MIVTDTPEYKVLRGKLQSLDLEISELTAKFDRQDAEFHAGGVPTPQAVRSELKALRSEKQSEFCRIKIQLENLREAFRIKKQTDLLDNLIAVCRENNNGQYLGAAMRRLEDAVFDDVEEGTPV